MDRILRNTASRREMTFYSDEEETEATGNVSVAVTKADGSTLSGSPFTATLQSNGAYAYNLPSQANLNVLTETWAGTFSGQAQSLRSTVEIVGGFYVGLAEIRDQPNVGDATKWDTQSLVDAREWFEDKVERVTGVAWVPRFARERHSGRGCRLILDRYPVRSVYSIRAYTSATAYTEFTSDELADLDVTEAGLVERLYLGTFPAGNRNIVVEYEHGFSSPPADLHDAALVAIRDKLLGDRTGSRQLSVQTEQGIVRSATASKDFPFGIPYVDAVVNDLRQYRSPAIA